MKDFILIAPWLLVIVAGIYGVVKGAWLARKQERRLSPTEQYLVMQVRKRRTMRQMRQVVRDHTEGRY
ncbi:hypothetical protein QWJ26_26495 [Streptomyces sp. CSDS2]|uniref:hypothetical protein n=1 Tax=Streptomyces sp. CSDS2 TaxID=3055051 RepID=UPI0025B01E0F|nr:hypothetical protein [Streptomyces sp. CSDS2]MDN3263295.1 hypothetical protein [Streptomyces sp. CSDS2]